MGEKISERVESEKKAISLIKMGYRVSIVSHNSGVSNRKVRILYKEINNKNPSQGMLPSSCNLIRTHSGIIEATLMILAYLMIEKKKSKKTSRINPFVIHDAFILHSSIKKNIYKDKNKEIIDDVNKAWVVVQDFIAGSIELKRCENTGLPCVSWDECLLDSNNSWRSVLGIK